MVISQNTCKDSMVKCIKYYRLHLKFKFSKAEKRHFENLHGCFVCSVYRKQRHLQYTIASLFFYALYIFLCLVIDGV